MTHLPRGPVAAALRAEESHGDGVVARQHHVDGVDGRPADAAQAALAADADVLVLGKQKKYDLAPFPTYKPVVLVRHTRRRGRARTGFPPPSIPKFDPLLVFSQNIPP